MTIQRMDNVLIVVDDLEAAIVRNVPDVVIWKIPRRQKTPLSREKASAGGRTRTCDTRIMIPLL
jgi:hypothetical protein